MTGTISNIVTLKKFGFISGENGQEYFFHITDVISGWDELVGSFSEIGGGKVKVSFETVKTPKGPRAKNVVMLEA